MKFMKSFLDKNKMRKLDLEDKGLEEELKEKETLLEVLESSLPRLIVRSNTGRKYTIILNDDLYQSKCSCPNWVFRGAKLAKQEGKTGRAPCKHLKAVHLTTMTEGLTPPIGRRFSILDLE